ncbi:hypothetical protein LCGC14_0478640 [marine sediment metagenome]|uniref:Peptidase C39 domain-containing protein n=1 Tax=marine sediment metagenome TaxID=412755 RepID=A0A0F9S9Z4_9ZZZZ
MINKQRHKTSCGPVAILNALKWKGYHDSYADVISFAKRRLSFKHHGSGMHWIYISQALDVLDIRYKIIHKATLVDITRELDRDRAVILFFQYGGHHAHYIFIDKHTEKFVRAWNMGNNTPRLSKKRLNKRIIFSNGSTMPIKAYVIL